MIFEPEHLMDACLIFSEHVRQVVPSCTRGATGEFNNNWKQLEFNLNQQCYRKRKVQVINPIELELSVVKFKLALCFHFLNVYTQREGNDFTKLHATVIACGNALTNTTMGQLEVEETIKKWALHLVTD